MWSFHCIVQEENLFTFRRSQDSINGMLVAVNVMKMKSTYLFLQNCERIILISSRNVI